MTLHPQMRVDKRTVKTVIKVDCLTWYMYRLREPGAINRANNCKEGADKV